MHIGTVQFEDYLYIKVSWYKSCYENPDTPVLREQSYYTHRAEKLTPSNKVKDSHSL